MQGAIEKEIKKEKKQQQREEDMRFKGGQIRIKWICSKRDNSMRDT